MAQLIACIITLAVVLIGDLVLLWWVVWLVVHYGFHF